MRQIAKTVVSRPNGTFQVVRKHDTPTTPLVRPVNAKPPISRTVSERLVKRYEETNPRALKHQIHAQLDRIDALALDDPWKEEATR